MPSQGPLVILFQVRNSVRPMHPFGHNRDHDYYFELPREGERDAQSITRCSTAHHRDDRAFPRAPEETAPALARSCTRPSTPGICYDGEDTLTLARTTDWARSANYGFSAEFLGQTLLGLCAVHVASRLRSLLPRVHWVLIPVRVEKWNPGFKDQYLLFQVTPG